MVDVVELPLEDWQRQGRFVMTLIRTHPLLQPLRDADEPVLLSCHARAIWIEAVALGGGEYELTARIEEPTWWSPAKQSRGHILAQRLAADLRDQWNSKMEMSTMNPDSDAVRRILKLTETEVVQADTDCLAELAREVEQTIRPQVIAEWMDRPLPLADGASPRDMILTGRCGELLSAIRRVATGVKDRDQLQGEQGGHRASI